MKILNIVSSAYRATMEEQDDTVVWLTHTLRRAGADVDLLLRGATANYVIEGQAVAPLTIGDRTQRNAPDVHGAVRDLADAGARILVLEEDMMRYGLSTCDQLAQTQLVPLGELPVLLSGYDSIWHW